MHKKSKYSSRQIKYPVGDKVALSIGMVFTLLTLVFFIWKMHGNLEKDSSLKSVPASTPTPPLKTIDK